MPTPSTEQIAQLRQAVEQKAGHKICTPKDFASLAEAIFKECHAMVSVSTLKRIWGYVQTDSATRPSSLTPLAQYVGFADWDAFVEKMENDTSTADATSASSTTSSTAATPFQRYLPIAIASLVAVIAIIMALKYWHIAIDPTPDAPVPSSRRVLHKGQDCFSSIDEYLSLFGVTATDTAYFQPLPGQDYVYLWGPEYGNTTWHNEGDKQQLMPTITEYWTPNREKVDYASKEYVVLANKFLYYERMAHDELRITFMRNIVDSLYVFLGIYRMDTSLSSPEKFVWRRISDSLDLSRLNQIEQLRK